MKKIINRTMSLLIAVTIFAAAFPEFPGWNCDVKAYNGKKVEEIQPRLLAGEYMLGVIAKDEKLYAWGNSYYPPDAYGVDSNIPTIPIQAEELEGIVGGDMAQGSIGVILQDRTLQTWGWNIWGMCGNGEGTEHDKERKEILQNVRSISMGKGVTMIVTNDNELYGCGSNMHGELTEAVNEKIHNTQVKIMDNIATACVGGNTVAAITTDGNLYTWGQNHNGKLEQEQKKIVLYRKR